MSTLPSVNPDVLHRRVGEEVVLVNLRTNQVFALNETGARFWELLAEGRSRDQIEQELLVEFQVESERLAQEIDELLVALERENMVRPSTV
jgi:hypothetical protein